MTQDEIRFVQAELQSPLDVSEFCRSVPRDLAQQVYAFSCMAINLDTLNEAAYLGRLGEGLGLSAEVCNDIHRQLGSPPLLG